MERRRGVEKRKTKKEISKQQDRERKAQRRTLTRRALILGGVSLPVLAAGGLISHELGKSSESFSVEDLKRATALAIDDYEAVFGPTFKREQVLESVFLRESGTDEVNSGIDASGESAVSLATTSVEEPYRITLSSDYLNSLPVSERETSARLLLIHELWHYNSKTGSDPETSSYIFSKVPKLSELQLTPTFTKGFRIVGTSKTDGKKYGWFNGVEEATAFAAAKFVAQKRGLYNPANPMFRSYSFQQETATLEHLIDSAFESRDQAYNTIASFRGSPQPLRSFAYHIGTNNLHLEGQEATQGGIAILSYVNSGNLKGVQQITG